MDENERSEHSAERFVGQGKRTGLDWEMWWTKEMMSEELGDMLVNG